MDFGWAERLEEGMRHLDHSNKEYKSRVYFAQPQRNGNMFM